MKNEEIKMTHTEIIKKLIGEIHPEGATHIDGKRFENLKEMCSLISELIYEISKVADDNKDRGEHSMKIMGEYANKFLKEDLGINNQ